MPKRKNQNPAEVIYGLHSNILETGTDHLLRRMYLYGLIDDEVAYRFAIGFNQLDQTDGDIHIHLASYGGEIESGFAIFDTIRMSRNRVVVFGIGPVMSMGVIILQAGDQRVLAPNAHVCIHDGFARFDSSLLKLAAMGREAGAVVDRMAAIVANRSGLPQEKVRRLMQDETFLTAPEALALGLADGVVELDQKKPKSSR
jgi:ATP-dependent Clp protease, protease subunit